TNILYGNIDHIQGMPYGTLIVELRGKNGETDAALKYLKDLGLDVEVIENV
ncbi:MAG TPA: methionine ABC transporter ATP-binding protein, partial [Thermoanaerobacter sp.]|nr:methionine ABC transporter ATP-binding protein [Thermoanaerobacter sp.]